MGINKKKLAKDLVYNHKKYSYIHTFKFYRDLVFHLKSNPGFVSKIKSSVDDDIVNFHKLDPLDRNQLCADYYKLLLIKKIFES